MLKKGLEILLLIIGFLVVSGSTNLADAETDKNCDKACQAAVQKALDEYKASNPLTVPNGSRVIPANVSPLVIAEAFGVMGKMLGEEKTPVIGASISENVLKRTLHVTLPDGTLRDFWSGSIFTEDGVVILRGFTLDGKDPLRGICYLAAADSSSRFSGKVIGDLLEVTEYFALPAETVGHLEDLAAGKAVVFTIQMSHGAIASGGEAYIRLIQYLEAYEPGLSKTLKVVIQRHLAGEKAPGAPGNRSELRNALAPPTLPTEFSATITVQAGATTKMVIQKILAERSQGAWTKTTVTSTAVPATVDAPASLRVAGLDSKSLGLVKPGDNLLVTGDMAFGNRYPCRVLSGDLKGKEGTIYAPRLRNIKPEKG